MIKMKYITILMIVTLLLPFYAYSDPSTNKKLDIRILNYWEPTHLHIKFLKGNLTENQYLEQLTTCSSRGNKYCDASLGEYYSINKKQYDKAYPLLLRASNDMYVSSPLYEPPTAKASYLLGQMYASGTGVLQNDDKAIEYFKKSVIYGSDQNSAMRIALIYTKKWREESKNYEMNDFLTKSYSWWKIAKALPESGTPITKIDGNKLSPSEMIRKLEDFDEFRPRIKSANKLAQQICSTIPNCAQ